MIKSKMAQEVFIVGCGYIGARVAACELARGNRVRALARSSESAQRLQVAGIEPVSGDLDAPGSLRSINIGGTLVYYFAPPPSTGMTDPRVEAFLGTVQKAALPERMVLISTTSVYGDCDGNWIDEDCPVSPRAARAHRRLAAENQLCAWAERTTVPVVILRVAGIYGPDKLPVERLRRGLPVLRQEESPWSNRVHADDLVGACLAAADRGRPEGIYNVADGNPSTMTDFFNAVADAFGLPRPPQVSMEQAKETLGEETLAYLAESRRVSNERMRRELGVTPRYPTLKAGLAACVDAV